MKNLSVTYIKTKISIEDDNKFDLKSEHNHIINHLEVFKEDEFNERASLEIEFTSSFDERNIRKFKHTTISQFEFVGFAGSDEDKKTVIEKYWFIGYRTHLDILKKNLPNQYLITHIKNDYTPFPNINFNKNPLLYQLTPLDTILLNKVTINKMGQV